MHRTREWAHGRLAAALLLLATAAAARGAEPAKYTLAVVPTLPAVSLHKAWTPFVQRLSKELGAPIELKLYERLGAFLDASEEGRHDFIFTAPNMLYLAHARQKYVPLVRGGRSLTGIVFVRKDSPYRTVADLRGKTIAFVGPRNLCSLITRHAMSTSGTPIEYTLTFSGSTVNVVKMVLIGRADAGATLDASVMMDAPEDVKELRVILETPPYPPHPLAAHPRVPPAIRERVAQAVLGMASADEGRRVLASVRLAEPVRADYPRDYARFAEFDFEQLDREAR